MMGLKFGCIVQRNDGKDMTEEQMEKLVDSFINAVESMDMSMASGSRAIDLDGDDR